jgi:hypothetical protein
MKVVVITAGVLALMTIYSSIPSTAFTTMKTIMFLLRSSKAKPSNSKPKPFRSSLSILKRNSVSISVTKTKHCDHYSAVTTAKICSTTEVVGLHDATGPSNDKHEIIESRTEQSINCDQSTVTLTENEPESCMIDISNSDECRILRDRTCLDLYISEESLKFYTENDDDGYEIVGNLPVESVPKTGYGCNE